jgi:hypothetical protein
MEIKNCGYVRCREDDSFGVYIYNLYMICL